MKILVLCIGLVGVTCADSVSRKWSSADSLKIEKQVRNLGGYQNDYGSQHEYGEGLKDSYNEDRHDDGQIYDKVRNRDYGDRQKYGKYEGPKEFVLSYDDHDRYRNIRYVDNVEKCDNVKDCKDSNLNDKKDNDKDKDQYDKNAGIVDERNRFPYSYNYQDWDDDKDQADNVNLVGLGKNYREDVVRPCALDDWQCIRNYFAKNSKCKPAYGPIPDPLYLKRVTVYFPSVNLTVIPTRLRVSGLGRIKINEFYVNQDTGNLVLALDINKLNLTTPKAYFRYKRTAKESIVLDDFATVEIQSGTFTVVIPKIPHLRLDLAEIHADIDDILPPFAVGPGAVNTDPDVVSAFAQLILRLPTSIQEAALFLVQLFTAIYIQENICDFGLQIISI